MRYVLLVLALMPLVLWSVIFVGSSWLAYKAFAGGDAFLFGVLLLVTAIFVAREVFKASRDLSEIWENEEFKKSKQTQTSRSQTKIGLTQDDIETINRTLEVLEKVEMGVPQNIYTHLVSYIKENHFGEPVGVDAIFSSLFDMAESGGFQFTDFTRISHQVETENAGIKIDTSAILRLMNYDVQPKQVNVLEHSVQFNIEETFHEIGCEFHAKYFPSGLLEGLAKLRQGNYFLCDAFTDSFSTISYLRPEQFEFLQKAFESDGFLFEKV